MTAPNPEETAEGICAALARAEAAFDKRGWVEMPKADRNRYLERALIAAAIRDAENEAIERAAKAAFTSSRSASHFVSLDDCQNFNRGVLAAETAVLALKSKR